MSIRIKVKDNWTPERTIKVNKQSNLTWGLTEKQLNSVFVESVKRELQDSISRGYPVMAYNSDTHKHYIKYPNGEKEVLDDIESRNRSFETRD